MQSQSPVLDLKNTYHGLQFRAYIVKRDQPNKNLNYPAMHPPSSEHNPTVTTSPSRQETPK